ncbi:unnamed protein product [Paramecium pentaurelia]|uniref:Uncharacterized protein n=1 Tax=Paramecium pentaurelia TaxID=43138 RepID=A0A8S1VA05_9CILI|nr:unnamed protein product [Paramecium pentaurelia]
MLLILLIWVIKNQKINKVHLSFVLSKSKRVINFLPNEIDMKEILRSYGIQSKIPYEISEQLTLNKSIKHNQINENEESNTKLIFDRPNINIHRQQKLTKNFRTNIYIFFRLNNLKH